MKIIKFIILLLLGLSVISCGSKNDNKGIDLKLKIKPEKLSDFLYIKMNYNYSFNNKFEGLKKNLPVYVHFWRVKTKEIITQDDHFPKNMQEWKKEDKIKYEREVFIPKFIDEYDDDFTGEEKVKLEIGIYDPDDNNFKIKLYENTFAFESVSMVAPELIYAEGWNQLEYNNAIKYKEKRQWRWTSKKAVCIAENPKQDVRFEVMGGVNKDIFTDQKVIIKINDKILDEFIPETNVFFKKYIIKKEDLGNNDEINITFETNKTFIPSKLNLNVKDDRELGIQIFKIYFRRDVK